MTGPNIQSRQVIREKFQSLLEARLVGTGKPCQAVYAYQKAKLVGVVPCAVIVSGDINPLDLVHDLVHIGVHTFSYYETSDMTEQVSENYMDSMAADVRAFAVEYADRTQENAPEWLEMGMDKTQVDSYTDLEGNEFRHEYFPFICRVASLVEV